MVLGSWFWFVVRGSAFAFGSGATSPEPAAKAEHEPRTENLNSEQLWSPLTHGPL